MENADPPGMRKLSMSETSSLGPTRVTKRGYFTQTFALIIVFLCSPPSLPAGFQRSRQKYLSLFCNHDFSSKLLKRGKDCHSIDFHKTSEPQPIRNTFLPPPTPQGRVGVFRVEKKPARNAGWFTRAGQLRRCINAYLTFWE